jgi:hypothetical protein
MANQPMGTTMGNPECEWVRVRLPLWVGVSDDPTEPSGEGGDLSPDDRRSIERHLGSCAACGQYRAGLEQALETLGLAADALAAAPEAPSLWPALERRIAAHQARNRPRWLRTMHGVSERGLRAWTAFDSERPLRFAWMRDSLGAALKGAGLGEATARGLSGQRRWVRRPARVMGTGVAAAFLALVIGLPVAHRYQESAQSIISANAQPLPGAVVPPLPVEAKTPAIADSANDPSNPSSELAQADPISVPEAPATEAVPASKAAPVTATANPAPAAPSRWNYDLEHGTPMPSYARDAKPVY